MSELDPLFFNVMFAAGGRIFLMPKHPGNPPELIVPDWDKIREQQLRAIRMDLNPADAALPQHRRFYRVTPSQYWMTPIYVEVP